MGEVSSVDTSVVESLVNSGYIPVISSVAADETGQAHNINADTVAGEIAAAFVDLLRELQYEGLLESRYGLNTLDMTGEDFIEKLANLKYQEDKERAAMQLLNDFRKGIIGAIPLELPPSS